MWMHFQKTQLQRKWKEKNSREITLFFFILIFINVCWGENVLERLSWHPLHIFATYLVERWFSTHYMNFLAAVVPTLKQTKGKVSQRWTKERRFFYHIWKITYSTYLIKLSWKPRLCWIVTSGCSSHQESLSSFEVHGSGQTENCDVSWLKESICIHIQCRNSMFQWRGGKLLFHLAENIHSFEPIKWTFRDALKPKASFSNMCSNSKVKLRNMALTRHMKWAAGWEFKFQVGDKIHF